MRAGTGNSYTHATTTATSTAWTLQVSYSHDTTMYGSNFGYRHISRNERRLLEALAQMDRSALVRKLARLEASRRAMSDAKSRHRRPPHVVGRDEHRRLPTYEDAMAARMAARRVT